MNFSINSISNEVDVIFYDTYFTGEYDKNHCFLEINSGTGGLDAQSCARIIYEMYVRWAQKKKVGFSTIDMNLTDEGIRSCTLEFNFDYAFGLLSFERGVHRIVRISPYSSNGKRQTSFVSVYVYPKYEKSKLKINSSDLRIETIRASGAGGQHVNTTDSAVRIRHIPTGITASCQNDRSQARNKSVAMDVLTAKLEVHYKEDDLKGEHISATWGMQIRSYVFNPYRKIKDHRTLMEVNNINAVLKDGGLDVLLYSRFTSGLKPNPAK